MSVIPWAIDRAGPQVGERRPPASGRLRVLFVGQLRGYKGLHVLLDAVAGLRDVSLTIVGDGPMRLELDGRIRWTSWPTSP